MKKNHFFTYSKICTLALAGAGALFFTSCAKDGFDDETFDSGVSNTQVATISADEITITPSADGKSQTITWPVVMGAGGYRVSLVDLGNIEEPIINDSIVDGCSVTGKREEDVNYKLTVLPLGNVKKSTTDASEAASLQFSTFTPTFKTIPAGSNLNEWFAANPFPEETKEENLNFDLEAGGEYTLSGTLDFNTQPVTLRSNSKSNHATINFTGEASVTFVAPFNLKYVDVDCSAQEISSTNHGIFAFSKDPSAAKKGTDIDPKYKWANPLIEKPVTFLNCNFKSVKSYFFWDNQQAVCAMTMLIDNCVVHLAPEKAFSGGVFWTNKGGQVNELYITNSTFFELDDCVGDYKYFYQAGMVSGEEIYADKTIATNTVSYTNSTFYHVTWNGGQWGNYNRMGGRACSHWIMTDCIFFDCSPSGVARRFLHGKTGQDAKFSNNTYMNADGTFQDPGNYDLSGTDIKEDPQFADPDDGDFTISGATQVARKTGDPRWLP
jgi:hypothetical protein